MTTNDRKEQLSYAYLHAVCAAAGFGCEPTHRPGDVARTDARVIVYERLDPAAFLTDFTIDVQLKATSRPLTAREESWSYWIDDIEKYEDLRSVGRALPKVLVVLQLPEDEAVWIVHSAEALVARECAYWSVLAAAPESRNSAGQTVYIPRGNVLSPQGLRSLAKRIACGEGFEYGG